MVKLPLSAVMALTVLVVSRSAEAQNNNGPAAVIGSPVTCVAKGYWSGNSTTFIVKKLDGVNHTADIDFIDTTDRSLSKAWMDAKGVQWVFKDGVLEYIRPNAVRFHLVVEEQNLKGSYTNYNIPAMSKSEIVFLCDGPTKRVIVH